MPKNNYNRRHIFEKSNGHCWYCGVELTIDSMAGSYKHKIKPTNFAIDHFLSKNMGGSESDENLVPSCNWCNCQKRDSHVEEFRDRITRLKYHAPKFTDEQLFYLKEQDVSLPYLEPFVFYFEKMGFQS